MNYEKMWYELMEYLMKKKADSDQFQYEKDTCNELLDVMNWVMIKSALGKCSMVSMEDSECTNS